ncbi:NADPH:quinone reductase [Hahella sp. CCB-MM4]|uniref:zinc-binding alcohol dehydrogenase family protein n=1 Tax=Hahella sp. (strain CCB-MM4) TaxID=1926491 RepID=UPI000B9A959F|nr:zinc-binding alcohol dehydrogenase family protein [Hahella sp. CCB-MM4]OZG75414.1 NADPH:quinone reductase [Hahella sp. CCB-MM4]
MKAIAYQQALPIEHEESLLDIELPAPKVSGRDLLVEVRAISVNPVDSKIRKGVSPAEGEWKVLGWDASGIVRAVGPDVTLFKPGDQVWYAGDISRPGSNAELQVVDERIVGKMPESLVFGEAAALPLTAITAWEMLFDRLRLGSETIWSDQPGANSAPNTGAGYHSNETLLIIGAAGGVGSIMTQLARQLTSVTVIGTASREESRNWLLDLGAHHVIDHTQPLAPQLKAIGYETVTHVVSLNQTDQHFDSIMEVIAPQGQFGLIDDPTTLSALPLKRKSVSLHWELMFTRSLYQTKDMIKQHQLLSRVAELVDAGLVRTTIANHFGMINAANLKRAHKLLESNQSRGKIVLEGFHQDV